MASNTNKRTLDAFFAPAAKKVRPNDSPPQILDERPDSSVEGQAVAGFSTHSTYPFPIPNPPATTCTELKSLPATTGKQMNDQDDLDLLYFQPYIPKYLEHSMFDFLRTELPFYRVEYDIRRGSITTHIRTPRYTTVFGLDETARFDEVGDIVNTATRTKVLNDKHYTKYAPRPIPKCLDDLRLSTEAATSCKFNFCLVNYYASGSDSISYHSDDERFLGPMPTIASFSLGARRDFLMKHKPFQPDDSKPLPPETKTIKLSLGSGDMVLMRGRTQGRWLHSIPKRSGKNADDGGRINITFRKAFVREGTENYYNYNVGTGPVFKWDPSAGEMKLWK